MLAKVVRLIDKGEKLTPEERKLLSLMTHLIQDFRAPALSTERFDSARNSTRANGGS